MAILILAAITVGLIILWFSITKKDGGGSWVHFFSRGKEAGFSLKETEMLRQLAVQCNLDPPNSLFLSQDQLDKCIYSLVRSSRMSGTSDDPSTQEFLAKLYDYRKKIEINSSQYVSISSSRQIKEGQQLKVLVPGAGVFNSQILKNTATYMTISHPANNNFNSSIKWARTRISVYFWREGDAGYVFDSEVINEVFSSMIPSLKITHGDSLFRTQKRNSIRVKMSNAAFLYLITPEDPPHKLEINPGLKCFLEDLSDTGCAVIVGGRAEAGLRVKVQFALDNAPICMTGTIRSMNYNEATDRTILRIEAEPLPIETRIHILGEMFGMLQEGQSEEIPFHVFGGK